ncbi:MAG TPA: O-antigen ligase family protein [Bryobacteraceae bacterium]|nr:O-antigen ligase family protein [Bryobacteraceae bacterium]
MKPYLDRAPFYLVCGSIVSILISIAASQILLGLALSALLLSHVPLRLPPIKLPLALFVGLTLISWLASGHIHQGVPQIRKLLVFVILLLVFSTFRKLSEVRAISLLWATVATLSAVRSLFQFGQKYGDWKGQGSFYDFYIGQRITGFMSHWMTFGGEEMIVLLFLAAVLFFSTERRWKAAGWFCAAVLSLSLVLGMTRSIFLLGFPVGLLYLLWFWHKWLVAAAPVVAVLVFLVSPLWLKERVRSIMEPHGQTDSNMHRSITRQAGVAMIRAHPLLGVGPEVMNDRAFFDQFVPADIPRPLPEGWYGHLHNIYLQYAAERGIATELMLLWMIGKMLWDFARALRGKLRNPEARFVLHGAMAVILAILAEGFLEYNLGDSEVLTLFLCVVSFAYLAKEAAEGAGSEIAA